MSHRIARAEQSPANRVGVLDAPVSLRSGRVMARAWSEQIPPQRRQTAAWSFITEAVAAYAAAAGERYGWPLDISPLPVALTYRLDTSAAELARTLGRAAAAVPLDEGCYQLSACYTAMLPQDVRSEWGAYYTPPPLTERLLVLAEEAGVNWQEARVLDPACGGGAFLVPVATRIRDARKDATPAALIEHLGAHLSGFEIDPFAAWLTQAWLEIAFAPELRAAGLRFPKVVTICDSLNMQAPRGGLYDLVIGNPPYGRVTLSASQREVYKRSLYGHANLYGLFTDLALRWTKKGGVIAYVTPTSFLAGEYFKALRGLIAKEARPVAFDFITARKGVFEDVLQEAMLASYRRGKSKATKAAVHYLTIENGSPARVDRAGHFKLPTDATAPWLAPRAAEHQGLTDRLAAMPCRFADWGYKISTGPLVWNRFKDQLRSKTGKDTFPLIWAESVTAHGRFIFRAEKKNHEPYFHTLPCDEWLKISKPCVLLQRTTAKEQARRLIAAELPAAFIKQHGSVVVENHLNMVRPINGAPKVSPAVVAAVLNSEIVDTVFRCISGSVAVSAFELESLPLPNAQAMKGIETLVSKNASQQQIERALRALYGDMQR